jgi:hypothetical protein
MYRSLGVADCDNDIVVQFPPTISCGMEPCAWNSTCVVQTDQSALDLGALLGGGSGRLGFVGRLVLVGMPERPLFRCVTEDVVSPSGFSSLKLEIVMPCSAKNRVHDEWYSAEVVCKLKVGGTTWPSSGMPFTQIIDLATVNAAPTSSLSLLLALVLLVLSVVI